MANSWIRRLRDKEISKCNRESQWLSMVDLNTLNSWDSSSRTDKIVYIGLAAAVDFQVWLRKNWEMCFGITDNTFHEQRKQSLEWQLCYLIIIMRVFWSKTWMLRGSTSLCSNLGQTRLAFRMNWTFNSWLLLQASNIFVRYTANGFVRWLSWVFIFEYFVCYLFCSWLCYWLHPVVT